MVIVIFGAAVRPDGSPSTTLLRRVEAAAAFGARYPKPWFIPTGGVGRHGPSEASVMASLLEGFDVPRERIILEETATDTLSSVRAVVPLVRGMNDAGPVYVATSFYHLPRCLLLMRLGGLQANACPPPAYPAAEGLLKRWYWRVREVPAIAMDVPLILALRLSGRL